MKTHCKGNIWTRITLSLILFGFASCESFVQIDLPRTELVRASVFASNATASAALTDIYYQMNRTGFASGGITSVSYLTTLLSDEQIVASAPPSFAEFAANEIRPANENVTSLWTGLYAIIYQANAIIEGVKNSVDISPEVQIQLTAEAKFIRAFCHFYLVNLFGGVPIVTNTAYDVNMNATRSTEDAVYDQIISDLSESREALPDDYQISNGERVRANRAVVQGLLARVYLYQANWAKAEEFATWTIENSAYALADVSQVTAQNNSEAILQLHNNFYPNDLLAFYLFEAPPNVASLRPTFLSAFEEGDLRGSGWIGSVSSSDATFYFPTKYHSFESAAEYSTVFRLAEQFLIRAEARAHLNNIEGALADINIIRSRAGLNELTNGSQSELLRVIEQERYTELFSEWGHRWFDLKRTGRAAEVLSPLKSQWSDTDLLLPIPESQIINDPAMKGAQNPGY